MQLHLPLVLLSEPYRACVVHYLLNAGTLLHQSVMTGFAVSPVVVFRMLGPLHKVR